MSVGDFRVDVSFLLDQLSAVMILVITGIGFLIHLYSVGYMQDDHNDTEGRLYARYFGWLNLFIAFMSVLVLADNYLLMFVGWEGVGCAPTSSSATGSSAKMPPKPARKRSS
jgi:NADH-quinone oxidoreductase subunit L